MHKKNLQPTRYCKEIMINMRYPYTISFTPQDMIHQNSENFVITSWHPSSSGVCFHNQDNIGQ